MVVYYETFLNPDPNRTSLSHSSPKQSNRLLSRPLQNFMKIHLQLFIEILLPETDLEKE